MTHGRIETGKRAPTSTMGRRRTGSVAVAYNARQRILKIPSRVFASYPTEQLIDQPLGPALN